MYTPCFLMPWVPEVVPTILPFSCLGHSTENIHPGMPTGVPPGPLNKERLNLEAAAVEGVWAPWTGAGQRSSLPSELLRVLALVTPIQNPCIYSIATFSPSPREKGWTLDRMGFRWQLACAFGLRGEPYGPIPRGLASWGSNVR